jgi:hypothetical protein
MHMKRLIALAALALTIVALPALAQDSKRAGSLSFASDFQTIPVVANLNGIGGKFVTYVSMYNPTANGFTVQASLFDAAGVRRDAAIALSAGELKTYSNFLDTVFNGFTGGGAVTLRSADSAGGQRNNRFIVDAEVRTQGGHYGTSVPVLEFAGSGSRSFAAGVTVDSNSRTNIGCFDQSGFANKVHATILDATGTQTLGSTDLNLAANGWFQTSVTTIVSGGIVRFEPSDAAVCYAVVVDNTTQDGRVLSASEYQP